MACEYKASVIISIYSNVEALRVVLDSLNRQTERNFEIIISEDADFPHVREFCAQYPFTNDYQLLTQPDLGWRKNRALNNAIRAARSEWLIFIDGDCVLHPRFVEFHLRLSGSRHIVAGKRVKLNAELSSLLLQDVDNWPVVEKRLRACFFTGRKQGNGFIEEAFFIDPTSWLGWIPRCRTMYQLKGCNMSFSKTAITAINGFDEEYIRPAIGEDIDLTWRFERAGYKLVSARNLAVQYHLHHKENWTEQEENIRMMKKKMEQDEYICRKGLVDKGVNTYLCSD
ncbi:glycosyltransferase [uncultured Bacteroides sp.]|jgi:GT2 family glycosyltransferase|uniref:glycosyltransferase n=1 Tax=uncultured Bacteroides sp. TaxID=162156 RepID=UPI00262203AA|nr:glycosyltransferase [uncultured Bacteroides sp.]